MYNFNIRAFLVEERVLYENQAERVEWDDTYRPTAPFRFLLCFFKIILTLKAAKLRLCNNNALINSSEMTKKKRLNF